MIPGAGKRNQAQGGEDHRMPWPPRLTDPTGGKLGQHRRLSGGRRRRYGWWDVCRGNWLDRIEELGVVRSCWRIQPRPASVGRCPGCVMDRGAGFRLEVGSNRDPAAIDAHKRLSANVSITRLQAVEINDRKG